MDFLARHYEKLVLVVCLLCLLWGVSIVSGKKQDALVATAETTQKLKTIVKGKKMVEPLDESKLENLDSLLMLKECELTIAGNRTKGSDLMSSSKFIICKNTSCGNAIPYNSDTCPYCETKQDRIAPDDTWADDLDGDGIPNIIEKNDNLVYTELGETALDYRYTNDGADDFDDDGFINYEEFRYAFDQLDEPEIIDLGNLRDASQTPPLAYILRKDGKPNKRTIPFVVKRIKENYDNPDPKTWKVELAKNPGDKVAIKQLRLDKEEKDRTYLNYTLVEIKPNSGIIVEDENGAQIFMPVNQRVEEKEYQIKLTFNPARLGKRALATGKYLWFEADMKLLPDNEKVQKRLNPSSGAMSAGRGGRATGMPQMGGGVAMDPEMGYSGSSSNSGTEKYTKVFNIRANSEFVLYCQFTPSGKNGGSVESGAASGEGSSEEKIEYYRVLPIENTDSVIRVQQISGFGGSEIGKPIVIEAPNDKIDFATTKESMGGMSYEDGGMPRRPSRSPRMR